MSFPLHPRAGGASTTPLTAMPTPVSELPQEQVDAIIRTKRKAREPKACYPCHTRKVKCDRNLPCDGCVKRDHADLCSYERPSKKRQTLSQTLVEPQLGESATIRPTPSDVQTSTMGGRVSISREEWDNVCSKLKDMEQTISTLRMGMEQAEPGRIITSPEAPSETARREEAYSEQQGILAPNELGNGAVHLGPRSALAYILGRSNTSQETTNALLEGGILPKLGLDNETATYPFVDLWSSEASSFDLNAVCSALPDDAQCKIFIRCYRDISATVYPVVPDIEQFEANVDQLLRNRQAMGGVNADVGEDFDRPYGMSVAFIGMLFAILAAGCQSSDLASKQRELTSQVYVCCSYQCLRMTNFLSQPTLEAIQTLLIIGNVLSYNMNPGVSYILLGMTLRMGLSLGLQVESNRFSPNDQYIRRRIWWSTAWQDSHFSLSYDRPSTTAFGHPDLPYHPDSRPGDRSYFETLCGIISLTLGIVRSRMLKPNEQMGFDMLQAYKKGIQEVLEQATPHLRDGQRCSNKIDDVERLALKLHASYITSELCRPALKSDIDLNNFTTAEIRRECIAALSATVGAYVELYYISSHAARSWIGLQRAMSSAFLLAVVQEAKSDPHILHLLRRLEEVVAQRVASESGYGQAATSGRSGGAHPATVPSQPGVKVNPEEGGSAPISGVTHVDFPSDPFSIGATASIPQVIADTQTQWSRPLSKSLRALQKLNSVLSSPATQLPTMPAANIHGLPPTTTTTTAATTPAAPSSADMSPNLAPLYPAGLGVGQNLAAARRSGSLPPPTPESSTSGEWNYPNLMDRASEYIHPPLWS
ncbi:hypothetical protein AJ80_08419 [Polytolypa hystricis UAMH7299]|uniref:Zn(2)-C6 fungal-type domain-containing protein n=1 Tax=Polytolypa hystricis (strain UAMH7299) TaxID=1447883 RepID=A0A2B7X8D4_POLH7|nr:hypothetical protein AJ80_08419 [Polytolypa hystricis UAMH7299]